MIDRLLCERGITEGWRVMKPLHASEDVMETSSKQTLSAFFFHVVIRFHVYIY